MDIQTIGSKNRELFPEIQVWSTRHNQWKGRTILIGYKVKINDVECYAFIGKNGLGKQIKRQPSYIPLYCEIAVVKGGNIEEQLGEQANSIVRLLPEYKKRKSYYRFSSFKENEIESAGQKLIDVLLLI